MRHWTLSMVVALATQAPLGLAQVPDHLKCYKVKDLAAKATYTADLEGLALEPGCTVKVPAKMLCVETTKTNVAPPPPGSAFKPTAAGRFACYKVKCVKGAKVPLTITDQFGSRAAEASVPKLLCAPADVEGPTPTTTAPTDTSTTTTASTTTTSSTGVFTCSLASGNPQCGGSCPPGYSCTNAQGACACTSGFCTCGGSCPPPGTCGFTAIPGTCVCSY